MKKQLLLGAAFAGALLISACSQGPAEVPGGLEPQFGSPRDDVASVVATDAQRGRIYIAGEYTGPYDGNGTPSRGEVVYFRRYNRDGSLAWKVSANTEAPNTLAYATAADTDSAGNVYFGWTKQANTQDDYTVTGFVSKYSPTGTQLFRAALQDRTVTGLALDGAGNVYVVGRVDNGAVNSEFVRKYSGGGKLVWERVLRGSDLSYVIELDIAADGSVYLAGSTVIPEEAEVEPTLVKMRGSDGKLIWRTLTGSPFYGYATEAAASGSFVYVITSDDTTDFSPRYVAKFRADGSRAWLRRVAADRAVNGLSADVQGNAYLTGTLSGSTQTDYYDPFALKYTPSGGVAFDKVFSNPETDALAFDIGVAGPGELYLVGTTDGPVNGKNNGGNDAFLWRLNAQGQKVWER